jgi:hypothetical protein
MVTIRCAKVEAPHLDLEQKPANGEYQITPEAVGALRAETDRIRALRRRSMKIVAAARQLLLALSTSALLSRTGKLKVDSETDSSGARFVTRASVRQYWTARHENHKRRSAEPAVPVGEVARFTGHTTTELMDIVRAGALEQIPAPRRVELIASSLRAWMVNAPDADDSPDVAG